MRRWGWCWLALALALAGASPLSARAQDATPTALPVVPDPADCRVGPRTVEEVEALAAAAPTYDASDENEAPRFPSIPHQPANDEQAAAIVATARELVACFNAGDEPRAYALFTDEALGRNGPRRDEFDPSPAPMPREDWISFVGVFYARQFPDGRVGAVVAFDTNQLPTPVEPYFYMFERVGDRWLFDEWPDPYSWEVEVGEAVEALVLPENPMP